MTYKPGDKVIIREDILVGDVKDDTDLFFHEEMVKYKGKEATIMNAESDRVYSETTIYNIDIDNGDYGWADFMLRPAIINATQQQIDKTSKAIFNILNL